MSHSIRTPIRVRQANHSGQAGHQAQSYFAKSTAILWDDNVGRRDAVAQMVSSKLTNISLLEEPSNIKALNSTFQRSVALVGIGEPPFQENSNILDVIRDLKLKEFEVICYGNKVFAWPIGVRCRLLLSGASLLLDSSSGGFSVELLRSVTRSLKTETERHLEEEQMTRQMGERGIIGKSPKMMAVFRWVMRVSALSDFPVLINGETGTGKELIANALHQLDGKRRKGPFLAANCSAISTGLVESELFGHRRGAFTGADTERKGLFRAAEGGVLFLDEIGDLSESLQAKLLRVLQEKRVLGVGFDAEVPIDVRVIAATNRNLEEMVHQGAFREDLYHRLNVLSVSIPPLRERPEDLQPLTEHFLKKYAGLNERGLHTVNADFIEALRQVDLSGNARQLENIVRRALLNKTDDGPLNLADLTPAVWQRLSEVNPKSNHCENISPNDGPEIEDQLELRSYFLNILNSNGWNLSKSLNYCERSLLSCALEFARGNQSQTARLIGITPRSVYNKVHKHKLDF